VTESIAAGGAIAGPCLKAIQIANTTTPNQLTDLLQTYNVAPHSAKSIAETTLSFAQSNTGQVVCLFFSSSGLALGVVEAFKPEWPWSKKLAVSSLCGLVVVVIVIALFSLGILGKPKAPENKTPPPTPSSARQPNA
jgi:hypothetical protein